MKYCYVRKRARETKMSIWWSTKARRFLPPVRHFWFFPIKSSSSSKYFGQWWWCALFVEYSELNSVKKRKMVQRRRRWYRRFCGNCKNNWIRIGGDGYYDLHFYCARSYPRIETILWEYWNDRGSVWTAIWMACRAAKKKEERVQAGKSCGLSIMQIEEVFKNYHRALLWDKTTRPSQRSPPLICLLIVETDVFKHNRNSDCLEIPHYACMR